MVVRSARPPPPDTVQVHTNDGECFPVRKRMLRPCIALTKVGGELPLLLPGLV